MLSGCDTTTPRALGSQAAAVKCCAIATSLAHVLGAPGPQDPRTPGPQDPRTPGPRYPRTPVPQRAAGVLGSWGPGVLGSWGPGVLGSWGPGVPEVPAPWTDTPVSRWQPWDAWPSAASVTMDTLGIEPRAPRMLSGCDTTTPRALGSQAVASQQPCSMAASLLHVPGAARTPGPQDPRTPGPQDPRTPVPQDPGTPARRWGPGVLGSWGPGVLGSWGPGVLGSWGPGVLGPWTVTAGAPGAQGHGPSPWSASCICGHRGHAVGLSPGPPAC